jgi:putative IMPACT (imprinted ancient) family translation regulator
MAEPYLTVSGFTEHEIEVRRSRFICALAPVAGEGQAADFVAARRKAHHAARHTCSAGADVAVEVGVDAARVDDFTAWVAGATAGRAAVSPGPLVYVPASA